MICAIHQPQYLPWLGYFDKIDKSDVFVFLDDTQFKKNEWQNRNKIKGAQGWQWLTVPVVHDFGQEIRHTPIVSKVRWARKHAQALRTNYGKAEHFNEHFALFEEAYERSWGFLGELNMFSVERLCQALGIDVEFVRSSELPGEKAVATEALVQICKEVGADTYLSGVGGRDYLVESLFTDEGIRLIYQEFHHPTYPQRYGEFISHLSVVDALFNCGPDALEIIRQGGVSQEA